MDKNNENEVRLLGFSATLYIKLNRNAFCRYGFHRRVELMQRITALKFLQKYF
jgi:hypothetical protein